MVPSCPSKMIEPWQPSTRLRCEGEARSGRNNPAENERRYALPGVPINDYRDRRSSEIMLRFCRATSRAHRTLIAVATRMLSTSVSRALMVFISIGACSEPKLIKTKTDRTLIIGRDVGRVPLIRIAQRISNIPRPSAPSARYPMSDTYVCAFTSNCCLPLSPGSNFPVSPAKNKRERSGRFAGPSSLSRFHFRSDGAYCFDNLTWFSLFRMFGISLDWVSRCERGSDYDF